MNYIFKASNFTLNFKKDKIRDFTDVHKNIKSKKEILIDGRDPSEFAKNHIPNAVNLPYSELFVNATNGTFRLKDMKKIRNSLNVFFFKSSFPLGSQLSIHLKCSSRAI